MSNPPTPSREVRLRQIRATPCATIRAALAANWDVLFSLSASEFHPLLARSFVTSRGHGYQQLTTKLQAVISTVAGRRAIGGTERLACWLRSESQRSLGGVDPANPAN